MLAPWARLVTTLILVYTKISLADVTARDKYATYRQLAKALPMDDGGDVAGIVQAIKSLEASQKTFKALDGAAHEAYGAIKNDQEDDSMLSVSGRAQRSARRAHTAAVALEACEFCELGIQHGYDMKNVTCNSTLSPPRQVLLNITKTITAKKETNDSLEIRILVIYDPAYHGGGGTRYAEAGGSCKGKLIVVVVDSYSSQLAETLQILDHTPKRTQLHQGLVKEAASVQPYLYRAASTTIKTIESVLRKHNETAVHIVGYSLSGGVAALSAAILEGHISCPDKKHKDLQGFAKNRVSAITLGAPPSMSANIPADYITSIVYGDDIVCRASKISIDRLLQRIKKVMKGNLFGVGRVADTISLASSSLMSHAHGSEGEETRLAISGRAFLIRPRRLGGVCSIHEIGSQLKGGREALRAAILWQLNDVLLSKSLWKHHTLDSYIRGMDKLYLRGTETENDNEEDEDQ